MQISFNLDQETLDGIQENISLIIKEKNYKCVITNSEAMEFCEKIKVNNNKIKLINLDKYLRLSRNIEIDWTHYWPINDLLGELLSYTPKSVFYQQIIDLLQQYEYQVLCINVEIKSIDNIFFTKTPQISKKKNSLQVLKKNEIYAYLSHTHFAKKILADKILNSSFFLDELFELKSFGLNTTLPNVFFPNFEKFQEFSLNFHIPEIKQEELQYEFIEEELPNFKIWNPNIFYGNCNFTDENIHAHSLYTPELNLKPQKTFKRHIIFSEPIQDDPYIFYMKNILGLEYKSHNQKLLNKIKNNIGESIFYKRKFQNDTYLFLDEDWINNIIKNFNIREKKLFYNDHICFLALSKSDYERIKKKARSVKIWNIAIIDLISKQIQYFNLKKSRKTHNELIY